MSNYAGMTFEEAQAQEKKDYCFTGERSPWISVIDKLPLYKQCVLVYLDNEIITEAVYRGEYDKGGHVFRIQLIHVDTTERVTHWMPLPEPPK